MPESETSENQPSSVDLLQRLQESFEQIGYPQLQAIECSVENDILCLTGELDSFYLKQVAQSVASKIVGPHGVQNQIKVK